MTADSLPSWGAAWIRCALAVGVFFANVRYVEAHSPGTAAADFEDFPLWAVFALALGLFFLMLSRKKQVGWKAEIDHKSRTIEENEVRFQAIFNTVVDAIITIDRRGTIMTVNPASERLFGYGNEEMVGRNVSMLMPEDVAEKHDGFIGAYIQTRVPKVIGIGREVSGKRKDGSTFPMELAVSEMVIQGEIMFTGILRDITERKEAEERIRHLANHDALTGLPSLRLVKDRMLTAIAAARRDGRMAAALFIDLDGFKSVNDTLGHEAGNVVLIGAAKRMAGCVREIDTVARIGGDEFLVVLSGLHSQQDAESVASKIVEVIAAPFALEQGTVRIGASVGIAMYPIHAETAEGLIKSADEMMYDVKYSGKNGYRMAAH